MFNQRSKQKELLDEDSIPFADIKQNMKELDFINKYLGGHALTLEGFKQLLGNDKKITVCEIGCGGGDNLIALSNWARKRNIEISFIGVDIKQECVEFAKQRNTIPRNVEWVVSDYKTVVFKQQPDIIFSSLFCHHFTEEELLIQFTWMKDNCKKGFFINDLQRHVIAYYSIKMLTRLFSSSYLVKNDAPLSVARAFTKKELKLLFNQAGLHPVKITWKWAFRFLVIYNKK